MNTLEQIRMYQSCIFDPEDVVEVRAIAPGGRVKRFWRQAHDLCGLVGELRHLNGRGYNIYCGPNPRRGEGLSGDENVVICRCLFCDFDGVEAGDGCGIYEFVEPRIDAARLPTPSLVVFSGHGIHAYWRLTEAVAPDRWRTVEQRLIATVGADPTCKNPERLMRLPGLMNVKVKPYTECFIVFADKEY